MAIKHTTVQTSKHSPFGFESVQVGSFLYRYYALTKVYFRGRHIGYIRRQALWSAVTWDETRPEAQRYPDHLASFPTRIEAAYFLAKRAGVL
jgi:hypothetical protein